LRGIDALRLASTCGETKVRLLTLRSSLWAAASCSYSHMQSAGARSDKRRSHGLVNRQSKEETTMKLIVALFILYEHCGGRHFLRAGNADRRQEP
jgi:hypothetical protein